MVEMSLIDAAAAGGTAVGTIFIGAIFLYYEAVRKAKKEAKEIVEERIGKHNRYKHDK